MSTDALGRIDITAEQRQRISDAFRMIPDGKRAAILIIADTDSQVVRGHFAANLGSSGWKVAAGGGFILREKRPVGWIGLSKVW